MIILLFAAITLAMGALYTTQGFDERVLDTDSYGTSMSARQRDLLHPFSDALDNPIIFLVGRGPSKAVMRTDSHNDFGWYFHRFGLPGLGFYLLLLYYGMKQARLLYRKAASRYEQAVCMASLLVTVNWVFFALAENIFKDSQLMAVNMFFLGLVFPNTLYLRKANETGVEDRYITEVSDA